MADTSENSAHRPVSTVAAGVALIVIALTLDYVLQRHGFFRLFDSTYRQISIVLVFPAILLFVFSTGVIVAVFGGGRALQWILKVAIGCSIPLTVLYAIFVFGVQALESGSDSLGECGGVYDAAISSHVLPKSNSFPGYFVSCGTQKRGMFLRPYDAVLIWGVKDLAAQQQVLDRLKDYHQIARTHRIQVAFIEEWKPLPKAHNGYRIKDYVRLRRADPEKLLRVINIE